MIPVILLVKLGLLILVSAKIWTVEKQGLRVMDFSRFSFSYEYKLD